MSDPKLREPETADEWRCAHAAEAAACDLLRIERDRLRAERDRLRAEVKRLREAITACAEYLPVHPEGAPLTPAEDDGEEVRLHLLAALRGAQ
jgi:histidinol-phosphate/aromatic aminotransferase/cobyric acid decarboxylase-like protein